MLFARRDGLGAIGESSGSGLSPTHRRGNWTEVYTPNLFEWVEQRTRETAAPRVKTAKAMSAMVEGSGLAVADNEPTLTAFENSQKVPTWPP